jgi:hypothetical protein
MLRCVNIGKGRIYKSGGLTPVAQGVSILMPSKYKIAIDADHHYENHSMTIMALAPSFWSLYKDIFKLSGRHVSYISYYFLAHMIKDAVKKNDVRDITCYDDFYWFVDCSNTIPGCICQNAARFSELIIFAQLALCFETPESVKIYCTQVIEDMKKHLSDLPANVLDYPNYIDKFDYIKVAYALIDVYNEHYGLYHNPAPSVAYEQWIKKYRKHLKEEYLDCQRVPLF